MIKFFLAYHELMFLAFAVSVAWQVRDVVGAKFALIGLTVGLSPLIVLPLLALISTPFTFNGYCGWHGESKCELGRAAIENAINYLSFGGWIVVLASLVAAGVAFGGVRLIGKMQYRSSHAE